MYAHKKNIRLRRYLKRRALSDEQTHSQPSVFDVVFDRDEPAYVEVFPILKMETAMEEHSRSSNLHKNHKRLLGYLKDTDGFLPLSELPLSIFDDLDALAKRFPNFEYVIEYYKEQFALAWITENRPFAAQPLLILGPPGVGKTAFCHELSKLVSTHFEVLSMSGMTAGFVIGGMSSGWADGKYGKVVQSLARGRRANPLIVADEIDKVGGDKRYDPLGALYGLLEKETAENFTDEALETPTDCSHAVWVATANYPEKIAEPILSRFAVIEVGAPVGEQLVMVLNSIYTKVRQKHTWGSRFHAELPNDVIDKLVSSKLEPRLIQRVLTSACGRAVLRSRRDQEYGTGLFEITPEDVVVPEFAKKRDEAMKSVEPAKTKAKVQEPDVVIMPIINASAPAPNQESEETIIKWSVLEVVHDNDNKTQHLVGFLPRTESGRVTSPIRQFDRKSMRLKTYSGRIYQLEGHPGMNEESKLAWTEWKEKHDVSNDADVTHRYCVIH